MPTLSIPPSSPDPLHNDQQPGSRPPSPAAPPYSPITPTMSNSLPATSTEAAAANNNSYNKNHKQRPYAPPPAPRLSYVPPPQASNSYAPLLSTRPLPTAQMPEPPQPVPISESTNSDAIALRAAMSILQLQRQQALRDMQTLEKQKEAAVANPEAFARDIASGKIRARGMRGILGPVGEVQDGLKVVDSRRKGEREGGPADDVEDGGDLDDSGDEGDKSTADTSKAFGEIPSEQNVVRMPPINWAKYHIVGESLDKLHEEQRSRPVAGQPLRDADLKPKQRAPEHIIASPYDPWRDKLHAKEKGRTRSGRGKG
ncbi:MAG: hypothetical protein ALECFALPRED_010466 [Alectoria fallacina]|uniref:Uncharacterized protein n=1 Tax=Alectoria fallacina TaxID=1903189 RepID=A0A8H3F2I4_9LECA|nr:MAG: hypothetical protein ALECFALPRED_010466 [Alectoria fallacina]